MENNRKYRRITVELFSGDFTTVRVTNKNQLEKGNGVLLILSTLNALERTVELVSLDLPEGEQALSRGGGTRGRGKRYISPPSPSARKPVRRLAEGRCDMRTGR